MLKDKKRAEDAIQYILLGKIGKGVVQPIPIEQLKAIFKQF